MDTTIFYYTGTGNSLWVARRIAELLGRAELCAISAWKGNGSTFESETLGLIFPVYIWGVPAPVLRFIEALKGARSQYVFAVAVNGGQVSNTLVQLHRAMAVHGLQLSSGFQITMPSNYIPWGGPGPKKEQYRRFHEAQEKISRIAHVIRNGQCLPVEKGPLWQRILFTAIYRMTFPRVPAMDRPFNADDRCNGCGVCLKVCPCGNITISEGRPVWNHQCEQCFACLQWCPQEAIQYGRRTVNFERYHHPEVELKDILKRA